MVNTELVELIDAGLERFGSRDLVSEIGRAHV